MELEKLAPRIYDPNFYARLRCGHTSRGAQTLFLLTGTDTPPGSLALGAFLFKRVHYIATCGTFHMVPPYTI